MWSFAVRRVAAWAIDCGCILGWCAIVAAVGVPLFLAGVIHRVGNLEANAIGALLLVLPVVFAAAWFESRPSSATPGKRVLHLTVRTGALPPGLRATVIRNMLKIGLPWLIGHAAVFALVATGRTVPAGVWVLTISAYVLPVIWIVSLFTASGRTVYDRISGTTVHRNT